MQRILVSLIRPGMVTARSIYGADGCLLLSRDIILTESYIARLKEMGVGSVYIQSPLDIEDVDIPEILQEEVRIRITYQVRKAFEDFRRNKKLDVEKFGTMAKIIVEEAIRNPNALVHLNDIRTHDDYTFGHSVNVCLMSVVTGIKLGYAEYQLRDLALGGLLHDLGKMLVPKEILNKPGKLTGEEMDIMKQHTDLGFELLRAQECEIPLLAAHVAFQHHEKFDGSGYSRGLGGNEIHQYARITAVADVYDALTSDRPYRRCMMPHEAYEMIQALGGTHFDPDIIQVFLENIAFYPMGSIVQLNTGQIGVVVNVLPKLQTRPIIRLIANESGKPYTERQEIDLTRDLTTFICKVLKDEEVLDLGDQAVLYDFSTQSKI